MVVATPGKENCSPRGTPLAIDWRAEDCEDCFSPQGTTPHVTLRRRRRGPALKKPASPASPASPAWSPNSAESLAACESPPGRVLSPDAATRLGFASPGGAAGGSCEPAHVTDTGDALDADALEPPPAEVLAAGASADLVAAPAPAPADVVAAADDVLDGDPEGEEDPRGARAFLFSPEGKGAAPPQTCISLRKVPRPARPLVTEIFSPEPAPPLLLSPDKPDVLAFLELPPARAMPSDAAVELSFASPEPEPGPVPEAAPRRDHGRSRRSLDALTGAAARAADALPCRERVVFARSTFRDAGVVHPNSTFRRSWDGFAALVAVAAVAAASGGYAEMGGRAFFLADVVLNARTGYVDASGTLVLRRGRVAKHYAATWLLPDLYAALGSLATPQAA